MRLLATVVAVGLAVPAGAQAPAGPRAGVDWPGFRGIAARGVDDARPVPLQWSVPDAKLVKWRTPVPGLGHSSPVVWGDQVCTASAISGTPDPQLKVGLYGDIGSVLDTTAHRFIVACFDKRTGKPRWERVAKTGVPIVKRHPKSTHAS
jgi:outer membrane protein assembly factor BamB